MADTTRPHGTLIGPINFTTPSTNPYGLVNVGTSASPSLVDINGDGDLDALIGLFYGNTLVQLDSASASATSPAFVAATNPYALVDVSASDTDLANPSLVDIDGDPAPGRSARLRRATPRPQ
jgi:hypothetical protein